MPSSAITQRSYLCSFMIYQIDRCSYPCVSLRTYFAKNINFFETMFCKLLHPITTHWYTITNHRHNIYHFSAVTTVNIVSMEPATCPQLEMALATLTTHYALFLIQPAQHRFVSFKLSDHSAAASSCTSFVYLSVSGYRQFVCKLFIRSHRARIF